MVLAFLVRIGLKTGFRRYELPALACALALIVTFIFTGAAVGLGATLIRRGPDLAARRSPGGGVSRALVDISRTPRF